MKNLSLKQKLLIVFLSSIGFTILFSLFIIYVIYSELYLEGIEKSIVQQGERTVTQFQDGKLSDETIEHIHWYNYISEYEMIVIDNFDELASYFPYKIDQDFINEAEHLKLIEGDYIFKEGFAEEFNKEIVGAIFPIHDEKELIGLIYIYMPLATVGVIFQNLTPMLLSFFTIFFITMFLIVNHVWHSMFTPLKKLQGLASEVSQGNYSGKLEIKQNDEIGQVSQAFNQMNESLIEQDERKKEFTSSIAHELRTPIAYISGYVEALSNKAYDSPEKAEHYFKIIENETERLNKLINDLADLNHLQENLYEIEKQPIAVAQLLYDTVELFHLHLEKKDLHLKVDADEDIIMSGDTQRIQQIFYNTIDNAIKYSITNGTISINLKKHDGDAVFTINNGGIIISGDDIHRVGERFFRTDKARNRTTGGTGLGLSIVKEIVRLHDGDFSILSNEEKGTTITVCLPILKED